METPSERAAKRLAKTFARGYFHVSEEEFSICWESLWQEALRVALAERDKQRAKVEAQEARAQGPCD